MEDLIRRQAAIDAMEESKTIYHDRKAVIGKMQDIVNNLPSAGQWIPVTERLPKDDEEVIVSCTDDSGDTPLGYTTVAWHFKGTWICNNERCFFITAWMPLPEPWKGGRR